MRVHLAQVGCRLNYSEMEMLARRLQAAGHLLVEAPEQAQVVVFNSCAVTADAVRGSRKEARRLHGAAPDARLVLTGCWATLAPAEAAALPGVALVTPNRDKDLLPLLLEPWSADFDEPALLARLHPDAPPLFGPADIPEGVVERRPRTRAFVKVQDGCDNRCTFCIVTVARGESRSRPLAEVVAEVQAHAAAGVQEVVLTGVHLGAYGREGGGHAPGLRALLQALLEESTIARIRLSSLEPWEIAPDFFGLWSRWPERLCAHLHLPLQAGSDRQLRAMARRCTTASFRALVAKARAAIPDLTVTTDLIAGFPGESEADFEEGLAFVEEMRFLDAHIFPFSSRPGTVAARMEAARKEAARMEAARMEAGRMEAGRMEAGRMEAGRMEAGRMEAGRMEAGRMGGALSGEIKRSRARRLREVVAQTGAVERARFAGSTRPVLWEGVGRPCATEPARMIWSGMTDNGLRVETAMAAGVNLHGLLLPARLGLADGAIVQATLDPSVATGLQSASPLQGVL
jgi:threonylcarbamoyladenosine tRNA methylthiotransferase MtaB